MSTETKKRRSSPRRFKTVEEIEREIDRTKTDAMLADKEADEYNAQAYDLMKSGGSSTEARHLLDMRDAARARAKRLTGPVTERLKERIGIMRTIAAPELVPDASIPRS
jgi:predicted transcriptional regulator